MKTTGQARAGKARAPRSTRVLDVLEEWERDAICRLERHPQHVSHGRAAVLELAMSADVLDLADITPGDVMAWLTVQPSTKTACNKRTCASGVFRFLMAHGMIRSNPVADIALPRPRIGKGADPLSITEVDRLISVAARGGDGRSTGKARARFYRFLWATAFRLGEAREQLWSDIMWNQAALRVSKDKARRSDLLPIPPWMLREMMEWPREGPHVFTRIPSHHSLVRDLNAARISGSGQWHRFRKGAITHLAPKVPLHVLAKFSRHRNISVLVNSYITVERAQLVDAQRLMAV